MTEHDPIPDCVKPDNEDYSQGLDERKETAMLQNYKNPILWTVLIWTMYAFQIAIALPAIYEAWSIPEGYTWTNHWSIIGNILGSLFVVSWIEKNIMNRDD